MPQQLSGRRPTNHSIENSRQHRLRANYGPWAVVTGASDGIGKAMASQLAAAGLNLVLVARRLQALDALAEDLKLKFRIETRTLALDLESPTSVQAVISQTDDIEVGLLAAVAGFGTSGRLIDGEIEAELGMIDVNCTHRGRPVASFCAQIRRPAAWGAGADELAAGVSGRAARRNLCRHEGLYPNFRRRVAP